MGFTEHQPKQGDKVLHCGHFEVLPQHFFEAVNKEKTGPATFARPDGEEVFVHWLILCEKCFMEHAKDPVAVAQVEYEWEVDEPIVTKYVVN